MNKTEATRLARRIRRDDPRCVVTDARRYADGGYALGVTDTRTGYRFVVYSAQGWDDRVREAQDGELLAHLEA